MKQYDPVIVENDTKTIHTTAYRIETYALCFYSQHQLRKTAIHAAHIHVFITYMQVLVLSHKELLRVPKIKIKEKWQISL